MKETPQMLRDPIFLVLVALALFFGMLSLFSGTATLHIQ